MVSSGCFVSGVVGFGVLLVGFGCGFLVCFCRLVCIVIVDFPCLLVSDVLIRFGLLTVGWWCIGLVVMLNF